MQIDAEPREGTPPAALLRKANGAKMMKSRLRQSRGSQHQIGGRSLLVLEDAHGFFGAPAIAGHPPTAATWSAASRTINVDRPQLSVVKPTTQLARGNSQDEKLHQKQKLETLGRLASGVAHDFNNLLSVIIGYSDLVSEDIPIDSPNRARIEGIGKAAQRAADLTKQILAFSRQRAPNPRVIDLNAAVVEAEKILRRLMPENIEIACSMATESLGVIADPSQIDQIILNLAINARDAMPKGGALRIETALADFDETSANRNPAVRPGRYVSLSVSDTGVGMDRATQLRLFEAFFTTKEPGKGTGLGLATIYNIVEQIGGYIWVYSEPGMGTTIRLFLPRAERKVRPVEQISDASQALRGNETILVVEDAESLRELLRDMLEHSGYKVLDASTGRDALATAAEHRDSIKLVISDVVMPEMSGPHFAREMQKVLPGTKIMFMSGYSEELMLRYGVEQIVPVLLQKPFTQETLLRSVRGVLDGNLRPWDAPH